MGFLHHTAAECDHHMRLLLLDPPELPQPSVDSLVRVLAHSTCVVDNKIRLFLVRLLDVPDPLQDAGKLLGIAGVHLAPECGDAEGERAACLS